MDVLSVVDEIIQTIRNKIGEAISPIFQSIGNAVDGAIRRIRDTIDDFVNGIERNLFNLIDRISSALESAWNSVVSAFSTMYNTLRDSIADFIGRMLRAVDAIAESISEALETTYNTVKEALERTVERVSEWVTNAYQSVREWLENFIQRASEWVQEAYHNVSEWLSNAIQNIANWLGAVYQRVAQFVDNLLHPLRTLAEAISKSLDLIWKNFFETVYQWWNQGFSPSGKQIWESISNWVVKNIAPFIRVGQDAWREITINPAVPASVKEFVSRDSLFATITGLLMALPMIVSFSNMIIGEAYDGIRENIRQESWKINHPALLSPENAVQAVERGLMTEAQFTEEMERHGYRSYQWNIMRNLYERLLAPVDLITLVRREHITREDALSLAKKGGYSVELFGLIEKLTEYVPSIDDLIRMAVREVFSPEQAQALGLYADFPEQFAAMAAKQGMSRETAMMYWAAHWQLPSPQMAFEMYHRGIIKSREELKELLRALDYSPAWRDKLIELAYNPLTRVDVRRMYAFGILNEEEVYRAYLDLGYSPVNARRLTEFTKSIEAKEEAPTVTKNAELTRAQIEKAYRLGIISEDEANTMLRSIGYDEYEAAFIIALNDYERELNRREKIVKKITTRYVNGIIDRTTAIMELAKENYSATEIEDILSEADIDRAAKYRLPSHTDLRKMLDAKLITIDEYKDALREMGYDEFWVERYSRLPRKTEVTA